MFRPQRFSGHSRMWVLTNPEKINLNNETYQEKNCRAIYVGIVDYFKDRKDKSRGYINCIMLNKLI